MLDAIRVEMMLTEQFKKYGAPPLTISKSEVDRAIEVLDTALGYPSSNPRGLCQSCAKLHPARATVGITPRPGALP